MLTRPSFILAVAMSLVPCSGFAQSIADPTEAPVSPPSPPPPPLSAIAYRPITGSERVAWTVNGTVGPRSLGVGVLAAGLTTGLNMPEEWGRTWSGAGKRYLQREADVSISNTMEAGLGALWGEEPRYIPSGRRGIWSRTRYVMKTVFLTQRRDGRLAPAWGRYLANTVNNVIENSWLPPSATTAEATALRSAMGFLSRLGGNAWDEFWPDAHRLLKRRWQKRRSAAPQAARGASLASSPSECSGRCVTGR